MQFRAYTVQAVERLTRDAVCVTLDAPHGTSFVPGQYLTLRKSVEGVELRRAYSICAPAGGPLRVGIKRVEGGAVSTWANTDLAPGDVVEALPPMGRFALPEPSGTAPRYLGIAAGSGITPILSLLETALETYSDAKVTLFYVNRDAASVMFRDALDDLKNRHLARFNVIHVLTRGGGDGPFSGRPDTEMLDTLLTTLVQAASLDGAVLCGPEALTDLARERLEAHGLAHDRIRAELFASAQDGRAPTRAASQMVVQSVQGTMVLNGEVQPVAIPAGMSLLDSALSQNLDAPYACKAGVCSTCRARITEGAAEMLANHAIEDDEVTDGYVLTCQAHPLTDTVAWDYDQAGH